MGNHQPHEVQQRKVPDSAHGVGEPWLYRQGTRCWKAAGMGPGGPGRWQAEFESAVPW